MTIATMSYVSDSGKVTIAYNLPTVAVTTREGKEYFLQGDEAADLLYEADKSPLGIEEYILDYFCNAA